MSGLLLGMEKMEGGRLRESQKGEANKVSII